MGAVGLLFRHVQRGSQLFGHAPPRGGFPTPLRSRGGRKGASTGPKRQGRCCKGLELAWRGRVQCRGKSVTWVFFHVRCIINEQVDDFMAHGCPVDLRHVVKEFLHRYRYLKGVPVNYNCMNRTSSARELITQRLARYGCYSPPPPRIPQCML